MSIPPTNCLLLVKAPPPHLSSLFPSFAVSDQIAINGLFHFRSDWCRAHCTQSHSWLLGGVEGNSSPQAPISYLVTNFFGPLFTVFPLKALIPMAMYAWHGIKAPKSAV